MTVRRVILVEDDPDDSELFTIFCGNRTDIALLPTVGNGVELMAFLESTADYTQLPHLIVLDQNMPRMNGRQTLQALRENPRYASISAVVYSTYADTTLIQDCKNLGAKMVTSKPIDAEGYRKMMDDFLEFV